MNISDYLRTALLNHVLAGIEYTRPTQVWAALYTAPPSSAGGGTEVLGSDYARVPTSWATASLGTIANSSDVRFPANGLTLSNWGTAVALGLHDSSTSGHLLFFGPLSVPVILSLGTDFKVATNSLTINLG